MPGKTVRIFAVSVLLMAGGMHASALTVEATESVTVTGTKWREAMNKFVRAFETPTAFLGKIARWERRLCPVVVGQNSHFTAFITQRVKYVALAVGAPVDTKPSCAPNVEIVFTTTPQDLIDNVRKNAPIYLGYATSRAERQAMAIITKPIQAWYTTETVDLKGRHHPDSRGSPDMGVVDSNLTADNILNADGSNGFAQQSLRQMPIYASNGSHIDDGIRSDFSHVLIVIDSTKLAGQEIVPLADYISMLALTQLHSLDACQLQPSIVNMLAADCDHAVNGLTQFDLAYLEGLYKMRPSGKLIFQRGDIADVMADKLIGRPIAMGPQ
jgi:hypothetical protein